MGPYCKFCGTRCFIPTTKGDLIKRDLKATCEHGIKFDMDKTFNKLLDSKGKQAGWLLELRRHEEFSLAGEISKGKVFEYEIANTGFIEICDFTKSKDENSYYRLK